MPVLLAEGLRDVLSVDSDERNPINFEIGGRLYEAKVVGLMAKAGQTGFTARRVIEESTAWGKSVHTTRHDFKTLLDELVRTDPSVATKLEQLNA